MKKFLLVSAIIFIGFVGISAAQVPSFNSDLRLGSSGPDVTNMQNWLIANGFNIPSVSSGAATRGYFGLQTQSALQAYQRSVGLPAYGFFGPMTRYYFNNGTGVYGGGGYGGGYGGGEYRGNSLRVISPNGGEAWQRGTVQNITWTGANGIVNQTGDIKLSFKVPACAEPTSPIRCMIAVRSPLILASGINLASGSFPWTVGTYINDPSAGFFPNVGNQGPISDGQYKIQICPTNGNGSQCAESANYFTITSNPSPTGNAPIINRVDAPTSLNVGQTGTWTVRATDPLGGTLSYSVLWGDEPGYAVTGGTTVVPAFVQTSTFTHAYANAGVYMVTFSVTNSSGQRIQTSSSVQVGGGTSAGPLRIISPNGSETWQKGTTQTITWTSPYYFRATTADLKLIPSSPICPAGAYCMPPAPNWYTSYTIVSGVSINQNSYSWNVGQVLPLALYNSSYTTAPDGQYRIQICESGTNNCESSDAPFTITSGVVSGQTINIVSPNGGETWLANSTHPIIWSMISGGSYSNVDIYLGRSIALPCAYSPANGGQCPNQFQSLYTLDRNIPSNIQYNWIVGTDIYNNIIPAGTYAIQVCPSGLTSNCAVSNSSFTITNSNTSGLNITPDILPSANTNTYLYYNQILTATGFTNPGLNWGITSGSLPPGLTLNKQMIVCAQYIGSTCNPNQETYQGFIAGHPTAAGTYTFTITVSNGYQSTSKTYSITVYPGQV